MINCHEVRLSYICASQVKQIGGVDRHIPDWAMISADNPQLVMLMFTILLS